MSKLSVHLENKPIIQFIDDYSPCEDAIEYLETQKDLTTAWQNCERPDWLLWAANQFGIIDNRLAAKIACRVVRETPIPNGQTVWELLTDPRSRAAIEVTEAWIDGNATLEEVNAAAYAARAAADDADAARVAYVAYAAAAAAAADAADAADAAYAAYVAYVAYAAAAAYAAYAARVIACNIIHEEIEKLP